MKIKDKPNNLTLHQRRKIDYESIEGKILEFIALNINAKIPIIIWSIVTFCDKLIPEKVKENFMAKYMKIYIFIKNIDFLKENLQKKVIYFQCILLI